MAKPAAKTASLNDTTQLEIRIGARSLLFAAAILVCLMVLTGFLTWSMEPGSYDRTIVNGREIVVSGSFTPSGQERLPIWRWFTAPAEVLWGPDNVTLISIIIFMLLVAGAIRVMQSGGILTYLITSITSTFSGQRYRMEAAIILVFMLFGSVLGSMEEVVVLVPLVVALALRMGWDKITGLGLSLGAIAFGFAAAISNPFTIGVAQKIAGLRIFSGAGFRIIIFILVYLLYSTYVIMVSRRREQCTVQTNLSGTDVRNTGIVHTAPDPDHQIDKKMRRSIVWFVSCIALMVGMVILASFIETLSGIILILVTLCFLLGGIGSGFVSGMRGGTVGKSFLSGIIGVAPGIILVLMAAGVKHILVSAGVMDTILNWAEIRMADTGPYSAIIILFGLVLVLNFFISSGSAKAFLIMPIVTPLADLVGLSRQSAVLAFMFGDGFSNILYPTNALLLICLAITGVSYGKWFRWIWKIELMLLIFSIICLLIAVAVGY